MRALPEDARNLLAVIEEDGLRAFCFDPKSEAVALLRDRAILAPQNVGRLWGRYRLTDDYERAYYRHHSMFRSMLNYTQLDAIAVRYTMVQAPDNAARSSRI